MWFLKFYLSQILGYCQVSLPLYITHSSVWLGTPLLFTYTNTFPLNIGYEQCDPETSFRWTMMRFVFKARLPFLCVISVPHRAFPPSEWSFLDIIIQCTHDSTVVSLQKIEFLYIWFSPHFCFLIITKTCGVSLHQFLTLYNFIEETENEKSRRVSSCESA